MHRNVFVGVSVLAALLPLLMNPYIRYVQHWEMNFGPVLAIGILGTIIIGLTGITAGWRTDRRRLLAGANVVGILVGLTLGYVT